MMIMLIASKTSTATATANPIPNSPFTAHVYYTLHTTPIVVCTYTDRKDNISKTVLILPTSITLYTMTY
jgi:hypothetical protein